MPMRIGPFGFWELVIIAVLVLLLFGPSRLPEMARSLSQAVREFRRGLNDVSRDLQQELTDAADSSVKQEAGSPEKQVTSPPEGDVQPRS